LGGVNPTAGDRAARRRLQLPGVDANHRLAQGQGESDLAQGSNSTSDRNHRLGGAGDQTVAHLSETCGNCDLDVRTSLSWVAARQDSHHRSTPLPGAGRGSCHGSTEAATDNGGAPFGQQHANLAGRDQILIPG
jgi:hypothetical protein